MGSETEDKKEPKEAKKWRVLFVEDSIETSNAITKLLEIKGYEVVKAMTLEEAKKTIKNEDGFTHLLCDYDLKGENGLEAAGDFNEKFPRSEILIFTGYKDFLRKQDVLDYYATHVFARNLKIEYKPVEQNQLFQWFNEANKKLSELYDPGEST